MLLSALLIAVAGPFALVWLLPVLVDGLSVIAVLRDPAKEKTAPAPSPQALLIVVAAHNESAFIQTCVESLMSMDRNLCRWDVAIVADNCTDDTARLARAAGGTVFERFDSDRPGKPAAIQWLLDRMNLQEYDAVVIVDADSVVPPGFADAYAGVPDLRNRAAQGYNDISNPDDSWLSMLGRLLIRIRYDGQYVLKRRSGLNNPLTGNGMCVGTGVIESIGWSSDALTENWDMYARYTAAGVPISYVSDAHIYSHEAGTLGDSAVRRRRWQAGRWHVLSRYAGALAGSRRISIHQKLDALAEIMSPGPVVHGSVAGGLAMVLALVPGRAALTLAVAFGLSFLHLGTWTAWTWLRQPNRAALAAAFARMPIYIVWRLVVTGRALVTGRARRWERSPRSQANTQP